MAPRVRPSQTVKETARFRHELRKLGLRVRELRTQRGWTIEHAAERMNFDVTHLAKIEAGSINLTMATLVRIAVGLGAKLGDLIVG